MKKLEKFADQRIAGINYVSKTAAERLAMSAADVDSVVRTVQGIVKESKLPSAQKDKIGRDIQELGSDLKPSIPKAGAMVGVSLLTDRGMESYSYTWGDHSSLPAAKPLGILSHVGGRPILALVGRGRCEVKDYDLMAKWIKRVHGYFEDIALPQLGPEERSAYNKVMESLRPLAGRLDAATRNKLIPALADGQVALVIDGKLKSQQFCREMPKMDKAMPMIEAALVFGVTNAELLREAMAEYREVWNGGVEIVQKLDPGAKEIAKFKIPKPQTAKNAAGTVYYYPAPGEWGIDKQIALSFGLSDKVAVVTASNQHSERLLAATPLGTGGVLADPNRPLAGAVAFDWAGLVDAVTPWVELGVDVLVKAEPDVAKTLGSEPGKPSVADQVRTVLSVLKVMRSITAESFVEDGLLVTHSLVEIRDLP
jgi:hypothetical protein